MYGFGKIELYNYSSVVVVSFQRWDYICSSSSYILRNCKSHV